MNIVGFNFTSIAAERKRSIVGTVNISNNIKLEDLADAKIGLGAGERGAIRVSFSYSTAYTPEMAKFTLKGDLILLLESKRAEELLSAWKENRQLPKDVAQVVMNHVLDKCSVQALLLAKDLGLPSPVPLPKVNIGPAVAKAGAEPKKSKKK